MGEAGRQRAIEHFSWDVIADATLQRYRALFE
jgi:glycosyltransferase involved in cell wall biosynthesis